MTRCFARCAQQMAPLAVVLAVALGPAGGWAQDEASSLRTQRQALERDFDLRESACSERFAVNACVDAVRRQRREALAPLRERELQLDAQERQQRADERRASIASKQAAQAARAVPRSPHQGAAADRMTPDPAGAAAATAPPGARGEAPAALQRRPSDADARAAQAAERVRAAQQRQRAAQATQLRVESRQREREASGRKADPLPVPASSPAAAR